MRLSKERGEQSTQLAEEERVSGRKEEVERGEEEEEAKEEEWMDDRGDRGVRQIGDEERKF